jgi:alpha-glucosidase
MAEATHAGVLAARPDERPFLVSRSGGIGQARFSALWTGDNLSNWKHLQGSIPMALNLALSGVPFCGPDVPGFGGAADRALAVAWYKAGFLFPFFRNHADKAAPPQEPWTFGAESLAIIRHYIRLRYKLLPYLYNLFVEQAASGEPILRPLFFHDPSATTLERIDDQFLVGPDLMQAPVVHQGPARRSVVLPGPGRWFDARTGRFLAAGRSVAVRLGRAETPLYLREGSLIPMQVGERSDNRNDLAAIELHVLLGAGASEAAACTYVADDGQSFGWERGERTAIRVTATRTGDRLEVSIAAERIGWKPLQVRVVGYDGIASIAVTTAQGCRTVRSTVKRWRITGSPVACRMTAPVAVG